MIADSIIVPLLGSMLFALLGWVISKAHALAVVLGKIETRVDNLEKKVEKMEK